MLNILKNYFHKYNKNYTAEYLLKREIKHFKKCRKILDVGCGEGNFVSIDKKRIQGIDINRKSVKICFDKKLKVKYGDALNIPFKNNVFDGVYCSHLIEHFMPHDAYRLLSEISRVLKPGGIFVLSTPVLWSGFYNDFTHVKPYNLESIERYLCDNGRQKTYKDFDYTYKKIKIEWRYKMLPMPGKLGKLISNFLYPYQIHSFQKNAYTVVLMKIK